MNGIDLSILWPALAAGLLVTATHVPLGTQVLARGIVFIDLAIAQIAGCGVILADRVGFDAGGASAQIAALLAALAGAFLLTFTERRWPEVQEAIIGVVFVMAATAGVLLLAGNVHGSEHLRDLLVGQILWVAPHQLVVAACVYVVVLALWLGAGPRLGRVGFYVLFAVVVTLSVQLVGVFLVFATLIVPPLATRRVQRGRLMRAYAIGVGGYVVGIALSAAFDVPTGPLIVWTLVVLGMAHFAVSGRGAPRDGGALHPQPASAKRQCEHSLDRYRALESPGTDALHQALAAPAIAVAAAADVHETAMPKAGEARP